MGTRSVFSAAMAVLLAGMVTGCAHDSLTETQASAPQTIGPKGVTTLIDFGKSGEQPFTLLTTVRLAPQGDRLEVCGAAQVLARVDLSQKMSNILAVKGSTLTLTSETGGLRVMVSTQFLPVTYKQSNDGKFKPNEFGASNANCVVTQAAWDERWSNLKFHGRMALAR